MNKFIGKSIFKSVGWTYQLDESVFEDKQVVIGFEHTSNLDTILSLALFSIAGIRVHTLIKKELFKGPFKPLLNMVGGIPVDRHSKQDIVGQMANEFAQRKKFTLVIAPEATRAKNNEQRQPIRTGFWHIAKAANVPIVLMYAHAPTKSGGIIGKIHPTNLNDDLKRIREIYLSLDIDVKID